MMERKFFENLDKVVNITNLDRTALERCATILQVMASGCKIDVTAFDKYCIETARLLVSLYPWYYLPASIHKVLIHGSAVIDYFHVPIGQLSEEAQEARNKDWKRYIFFSCVFTFLFLISDTVNSIPERLHDRQRTMILSTGSLLHQIRWLPSPVDGRKSMKNHYLTMQGCC